LKAAIGWSYGLLSEEERRVFGELSVFAGGFTLAAMAAVCCGGDQAAALDLVDQLAAKSLLVAQPAAGGTRYRLLETIRQYAAGRLADAGQAEQARRRHAETFLRLAEEEREPGVLACEQDNFRAALDFTLGCGSPAGPRLARALGRFWLARGLFQEGRRWLERALAVDPPDERLRADLHWLLGEVLYAAGDLDEAQATLRQGSEAAAVAGASSVQARHQVLLAEINAVKVGRHAEALEVCAAAAAVLESEGDLEGLAEVWLLVGKLRLWGGDTLAAEHALQSAAADARQSGNYRVQRECGAWLVAVLGELPVPVDVAANRAEQLLEAASGDPWAEAGILNFLAEPYGYAGRLVDARTAYRRARSIFTGSGAKLAWAASAQVAGRIELMAGDPAAAERTLQEAAEALRPMGERGYRAGVVALLTEAVYAQGRLGQALWLSEETEALAGPDDWEVQTRWRATRAKLLARRGQFPAAARLAEEAVALVPVAYDGPARAESLVAQAEVAQLAGALDQAEASLRQALEFYEDRRMVPFAEQVRALLASLAEQRSTRAEQGTAAKAGEPQAGRSSPAAEARAAPDGESKPRPSRPRKAAVADQAEAAKAPAREPRPGRAPRPGVPRS